MGRGASKLSGGNLYQGIIVNGNPGAYQQQADAVMKGVYDVLDDFGMRDELKAVYFTKNGTITSRVAQAGMNGLGDLSISTSYLSKPENTSNYVVSDTFYGTGAHEAGHAVINGLLKSNNVLINSNETNKTSSRINLERATARQKMKLEKFVLKEATKRYGSNPAISKYGSTKFTEKVAEAISDFYANKGKANPYSKVIVDVLKDINKGKIKPKLSVSKSEMGI